MGVRWVINFGTSSGLSATVAIEDASYSSNTPILLTPADNPFTLSRRQTDFYQPILKESGLISIIDTGDSNQHIDDIHPQNASARPVSVYYDGSLYWRGYLSPEALTIDYGPVPRVISFPVIGPFDMLSSISITGDEIEPKPVAFYLTDILQTTGFNWSNIYIDRGLYAIIDSNSPDGAYSVPELRLGISVFGFFKPDNSINTEDSGFTPLIGLSFYEVLRQICEFFGWTIIPDGYNIYLVHPETDAYSHPVKLSYNDLFSIAVDPFASGIPYIGNTSRPLINLSTLNWSGINHRKTINNGLKRITISHQQKEYFNQFPQLFFNGKTDVSQIVTYNLGGTYMAYELLGSVNFLDPTPYPSIELYSYTWNSGGFWDEITWAPYVYESGKSTPRADLVKKYWDMVPWPSSAQDSENKTNCLRICRAYYPGYDSGMHILDYSNILAKITSICTTFCPSNGALFLNGLVSENYYDTNQDREYIDHEGLIGAFAFSGHLRLSVKIGNKYFDGTKWTTSFAQILVQVESGKIKNTNSSELYGNAEGYCMPLKEDLFGHIEIRFYPWPNTPNIDTLFIHDLEFSYHDANNSEPSRDINQLSITTGSNFDSEKEITLSLVSPKNTIISPSIVYWNGKPLGKNNIFYPNYGLPGQQLKPCSMPEEFTLVKMKETYSKPSIWLTLETVFDPFLTMWTIITNNNQEQPDNKKYLIVGMDIDLADNTTKLYLATYH